MQLIQTAHFYGHVGWGSGTANYPYLVAVSLPFLGDVNADIDDGYNASRSMQFQQEPKWTDPLSRQASAIQI